MPNPSAETAALTRLAVDDLTPKAAVELIQKLFESSRKPGEALYRAFRAWTWRTLAERRYEGELREWWELMRMTGALLAEGKQGVYAERLQALCDLVYESIQFGEHEPVEHVLRRVHVREALQAMRDGWLSRPSLQRQLGLQQSNTTRLLTLLQARGLAERQMRGRVAWFRLTKAGWEAVQDLPAQTTVAEPMRAYVRGKVVRPVSRERWFGEAQADVVVMRRGGIGSGQSVKTIVQLKENAPSKAKALDACLREMAMARDGVVGRRMHFAGGGPAVGTTMVMISDDGYPAKAPALLASGGVQIVPGVRKLTIDGGGYVMVTFSAGKPVREAPVRYAMGEWSANDWTEHFEKRLAKVAKLLAEPSPAEKPLPELPSFEPSAKSSSPPVADVRRIVNA